MTAPQNLNLVRSSWADDLIAARSLIGVSRTSANCPWTPYQNIDDCSYFQSWLLFGGRPGAIGWVDDWKTAPHGVYHAGKSGMQTGDVVLFDWDGNGVGNHVERCIVPPGPGGSFSTIGANGSDTTAVKIRSRNGYVLGFFRPTYPATATAAHISAAAVVTHSTPTLEVILANIDSYTRYVAPNSQSFVAAPGVYFPIGTAVAEQMFGKGTGGQDIVNQLTSEGIKTITCSQLDYDRKNALYATMAGKGWA